MSAFIKTFIKTISANLVDFLFRPKYTDSREEGSPDKPAIWIIAPLYSVNFENTVKIEIGR